MHHVLSGIGAAAILFAFWALQTKRMRSEQPFYQAINLVGAGLLATASFMTESWSFLVLNTVWALVALWALIRRPKPE
jgi:ABC-type enterobactin transport system permease subunit